MEEVCERGQKERPVCSATQALACAMSLFLGYRFLITQPLASSSRARPPSLLAVHTAHAPLGVQRLTPSWLCATTCAPPVAHRPTPPQAERATRRVRIQAHAPPGVHKPEPFWLRTDPRPCRCMQTHTRPGVHKPVSPQAWRATRRA